MNAREYCNGSMEELRENLGAFSPAAHDAADPNSRWNDIRLNADSLHGDYTTALILEIDIDSDTCREIAALLQRAVNIMPGDVDPRVVENMQNHIADVLLATAADI